MEKFYMIYVEGKNMPFKRWENLHEAEAEAERLCEKEKSKTFVLQSVCKFELKNIEKTIIA
jgi:hypothetical protein